MHSAHIVSLLQALLLVQPAACAFSLDDVVTDWWYYVHNHLADTTSPACLAAYAAPIDCDVTLLGVVSSNSPNFNPEPADLERTCVPSCADSLDAWVQNVKQVCNQEGDAALVHGAARPYQEVPVAVVGEVFQYEYAWMCSRNISGWCYFNYPASQEWARTDFTCTNECASQFFADAHNHPASNYYFGLYELEDESDWWKNQFAEGWDHLVKCRKMVTLTPTRTTSSILTSTTWSSTTTDASTETTTTKDAVEFTSTSTDSLLSSQSETTGPTASSIGIPENNRNTGGRLRPPVAFRALVWK
ncbi:hypothetical protein HD806DRAFT_50781 [Xylariaceae sp. AK1471]|nr:hypothetical protein HD806DRAFT_50781 [Xylariaceae sp. AK1471]